VAPISLRVAFAPPDIWPVKRRQRGHHMEQVMERQAASDR
jgi:hypothetical protein